MITEAFLPGTAAYMMNEISKRYGTIQRARNCYLYTKSGVRLVDMYQEEGSAILGWRTGKAQLALKNTLERGLIGCFPTEHDKNFERAVHAILPKNFAKGIIRIYTGNLTDIQNHILQTTTKKPNKAAQSLKSSNSSSSTLTIKTWHPWCEITDYNENMECVKTYSLEEIDVLLIKPPFPWTGDICIAAYASGVTDTQQSTIIPPALKVAFTRAFYDLAVEIPQRSNRDFEKLNNIMAPYFIRNGAWFITKYKTSLYNDLFKHFLDCHILISPNPLIPSVFPWGASKGDFTLLKNNPFEKKES